MKKMSQDIIFNGNITNTFREILDKSVLAKTSRACKNCGYEIFWTDYLPGWAHRAYHDDQCNAPEAE